MQRSARASHHIIDATRPPETRERAPGWAEPAAADAMWLAKKQQKTNRTRGVEAWALGRSVHMGHKAAKGNQNRSYGDGKSATTRWDWSDARALRRAWNAPLCAHIQEETRTGSFVASDPAYRVYRNSSQKIAARPTAQRASRDEQR